jgi:ABC-type nitrate/sulfonate/bicarbonate transport system substrate-binding protein
MLVDIAKANIPGLQLAYGFTEQFIKQNPNTVAAFLKGIAEGVARTKNDPAAAKRAIAKFTQTEDAKVIDDTYDFYAPYFVTHLALRPEQLTTWFGYLDEKEYPGAAKANPRDFYDNSFVEALEKAGFFQKLGASK